MVGWAEKLDSARRVVRLSEIFTGMFGFWIRGEDGGEVFNRMRRDVAFLRGVERELEGDGVGEDIGGYWRVEALVRSPESDYTLGWGRGDFCSE